MEVFAGVISGVLVGSLLASRAVSSVIVKGLAGLTGRLLHKVTPEHVLEGAKRDPYLGRDYARPQSSDAPKKATASTT